MRAEKPPVRRNAEPQDRREAQIPPSMRAAYRQRKASRKMAVTAQCQECTGYDREAIRNCTDAGCPLWHWRPYQPSEPERVGHLRTKVG